VTEYHRKWVIKSLAGCSELSSRKLQRQWRPRFASIIALILATRGLPGLCVTYFSPMILRRLGWRRPASISPCSHTRLPGPVVASQNAHFMGFDAPKSFRTRRLATSISERETSRPALGWSGGATKRVSWRFLRSWRLTALWDGPRSTRSRKDPTTLSPHSPHRHGGQSISSSRLEARGVRLGGSETIRTRCPQRAASPLSR